MNKHIVKTSITHPLEVNPIANVDNATLYITFCPGKKDKKARTGIWDRDIDMDVRRLQELNIKVLVLLIENKEINELQVTTLPEKCIIHDISLLWYPIVDNSIPDNLTTFEELIQTICNCLSLNYNVAVVCKGGLGRSGMVSACVLTKFGMSPSDAIKTVQQGRPHSIGRHHQQNFVKIYSQLRKN